MTPQPQRLFDIGAQAERTALAWQRTGLATVGIGALLFHLVGDESLFASIAGAAGVLGGALSAALLAPMRYRRIVASIERGSSPVSSQFCGAAALLLVVIGVVATVSVVLPPLR